MVSQELTLSAAQTDDTLAIRMYRLSVEQYHAMATAGMLTEADQLELLEGWLVEKMTKNRPHSIATQQARDLLSSVIPSGWYVDDQEPITLTDSEPEPDLIIVRGARRDYLDSHPTPPNIALVVEVSDSTLKLDRVLKARIYAAAGIPYYWLLNLIDRQLELHSQPTGTGKTASYMLREKLAPTAQVPLILAGAEIARLNVGDLLP